MAKQKLLFPRIRHRLAKMANQIKTLGELEDGYCYYAMIRYLCKKRLSKFRLNQLEKVMVKLGWAGHLNRRWALQACQHRIGVLEMH